MDICIQVCTDFTKKWVMRARAMVDTAIFFIASMLMIAEAWNSYKNKE
jgi:hypothetical protein